MTAMQRAISVLACLMGALGVAAAAASAHGGGERLAPAAQLLLVHAAASLALQRMTSWTMVGLYGAVAGMELGSLLFSADMAMRTFQDRPLFPMAAPTGGTIVILSWLVAAIAVAGGGRERA